MMKKWTYFIPLLLVATILGLGNSGGRAEGNNQGNTGAPGDQTNTCLNCHNSGAIFVDVSISVTDMSGNELTAYVPGEVHNITYTVAHTGGGTPSGYGFQSVALVDADESDVAGFKNPAATIGHDDEYRATIFRT